MRKTAKLLARTTINNKEVSFFAPPHNEADFVWVDIEELASAFLPRKKAKQMVKHSQNLFPGRRSVATVANGLRVVTIVSHPVAQGFCSFIDKLHGHDISREDGMNGPAYRQYCFTSAQIENEHGSLHSFEDIAKAFKNQGGPFLRGLGDA